MVSNMKSGQLNIKLSSAVLTRDTEFWGRMCPFVEIVLGKNK